MDIHSSGSKGTICTCTFLYTRKFGACSFDAVHVYRILTLHAPVHVESSVINSDTVTDSTNKLVHAESKFYNLTFTTSPSGRIRGMQSVISGRQTFFPSCTSYDYRNFVFPLQADKIETLVRAAGVDVEPFWPGLFAKCLSGMDIGSLLASVGSAAGGAAPAAGGAGGAPAEGTG